MEMNINQIDTTTYQQIKVAITSKDSVVGIDAVLTHILIINKLMQIEEQLQKMQQQLNAFPK
jgi:hypothetical protein